MKRLFTLILLVAACATFATAQVNYSLYIGGTMPTGTFGNNVDNHVVNLAILNDDYNDGAAAFGFNVGGAVRLPILLGLSAKLSLDLFYNGLTSDAKDKIKGMADEIDGMEFDMPAYINIPLMVGLNYRLPFGNRVRLFVEGAVGANFRIIKGLGISYEDGPINLEEDVEYASATTMAYQFGLGCTIKDRYSIGVHYYALGGKQITADVSVEEGRGKEIEKDVKMGEFNTSMMAIRLGYNF